MLKKLLPKSEFARNVLTLFTGTAFAQIIVIAISPLLTRLYTPEDFGILAIYVSLSALVGIIATGRYEFAIVLPEDDKDALSLFALSVLIATGLSVCAFFCIWLLGSHIAGWYNEPKVEFWLYFIPLTVLLTGFYQALNFWSTRKKQFKNISASKITDSFSGSLFKIAAGVKSVGAGGLIAGNIFGQLMANSMLIRFIWNKNLIKDLPHIKTNIFKQAKIHSAFLKYNSLHAFSDVLQSGIVIFLITAYFGSSILGLFAFTLRMLKTPLGFIGSSVSQVFYQRASEKYANDEDIRPMAKKIVSTLAKIGAPVFLILLLWGSNIFAFIFGEEWYEAGHYASILSPWLYLNFVISPLSVLPMILKKQKTFFLLSLSSHICAVMAIFAGGYILNDLETGLYIFSTVLTLFSLIILSWFLSISRKN